MAEITIRIEFPDQGDVTTSEDDGGPAPMSLTELESAGSAAADAGAPPPQDLATLGSATDEGPPPSPLDEIAASIDEAPEPLDIEELESAAGGDGGPEPQLDPDD